MFRPWIYLLCLAVAIGAVTAQYEYWNGDYEDTWWSDEAPAEKLGLNESGKEAQDTENLSTNDEYNFEYDDPEPKVDMPIDDVNDDKLDDPKALDEMEGAVDETPLEDNKDNVFDLQAEIEQIREDLDEPDSKVVDNLDDYQFEDNRSEAKKSAAEESAYDVSNDASFEDKDNNDEEVVPVDENVNKDVNYPEFAGVPEGDSVPIPAPDIDQVVEDTKNLLEEGNESFEEDIETNYVEEEKEIPSDEDLASDETSNENINKNISMEDDENIKEDSEEITQNKQSDEMEKYIEDAQNQESSDFESDDDIMQIMDAGPAKLKDDITSDNEHGESQKNLADDTIKNENNDDLKYNIEEEDEDTVDEAYKDLQSDLDKLIETWDKLSDSGDNDNVLDYEDKYGKPFREDVVLSQRDDYDNYDGNNDDNIDINSDDIFSDQSADKIVADSEDNHVSEEKEAVKNNEQELLKSYENDALVAQKTASEEVWNKTLPDSKVETSSIQTIDVGDLSPSQYNDLMTQFAAVHSEELDTLSEDFDAHIAPVYISITADEAVEITSPDFPSPYPNNNVIDWILDGEGMGIELNVTDLELRGANEDFLLIKPGGMDDRAHGGLVFSYHLSEPRRYRFTDVDRAFIRFQTGPGLSFLKGFRMSVKMIWPPENVEPEPEPEAVAPPPPATLTVSLGGLTVNQFNEVQETFRRIIADMATVFINANLIDMGSNTTLEVTQITKTSICNINWPNYENCVAVTFGIPLLGVEDSTRLNDTDLRSMWTTYSGQDPFALRLRMIGLSEFEIPNDGRVLTVWLVLGVGAIMSAVLLAAALWRYSCFEDYTRMKEYSDTDSLREEKRGLDLYPTPHQTLPPLYSDIDYKWADAKNEDFTRVDMGGFANQSYVRDELLDIDSDDDVIVPHDKNSSASPREIYKV